MQVIPLVLGVLTLTWSGTSGDQVIEFCMKLGTDSGVSVEGQRIMCTILKKYEPPAGMKVPAAQMDEAFEKLRIEFMETAPAGDRDKIEAFVKKLEKAIRPMHQA